MWAASSAQMHEFDWAVWFGRAQGRKTLNSDQTASGTTVFDKGRDKLGHVQFNSGSASRSSVMCLYGYCRSIPGALMQPSDCGAVFFLSKVGLSSRNWSSQNALPNHICFLNSCKCHNHRKIAEGFSMSLFASVRATVSSWFKKQLNKKLIFSLSEMVGNKAYPGWSWTPLAYLADKTVICSSCWFPSRWWSACSVC